MPDTMAESIREFAERCLVNIVGGCCGTTPDHIAAIKKACDGIAPREPPKNVHEDSMMLSGLDMLVNEFTNFVNIGERCNVAGSRRFCILIKNEKYGDAPTVARMQVENEVHVIDVNMNYGLLDGRYAISKFLRHFM
ncbi:hypothetical protein L596_000490 [Steinernema carpocapsae]|uniref:Hcy-binding domain-containing protein n=2 Tax=Steinernema carpocapsae TaxID=34508 RepID=A0A4U8UJ47_STECR|nr:hypothetical protein L596_000490 [Steinernema carpocapsae]